jgi:similar to stage IV sporulation protein
MTSQFVTDIYIQTPEGIKEEEVRKELYQAGLKPGLYKKNIQRKEIREYIMKKFDDVAYVSINVSGTNVFVNITKKAETLESTEESNYCNIIAQKSGIIEKVIARSGNSVVNVGDIIQKGDMLITGANSKSIPEVWASTFYEVKKSASYIETQSEKTGEKKNVYTLSFYDKSYTIRRNIKYDNYIIENKEHKLSIKDYTFPVKIGVSTFYETVNTKVEKDKEELKEELSNQVLKELEYIIPASAKIVDVSHKHNVNNGLLEYSITVTASENIIQVYPLTKAQAQEFIEQESTEEEESVPINPDKIPKTDIRNELNNDKRLEE